MFLQKIRLCVSAFLAGYYRNKSEKNRSRGLRLIARGEPLTSKKVIKRNHLTANYGYMACEYEQKYLIIRLLIVGMKLEKNCISYLVCAAEEN